MLIFPLEKVKKEGEENFFYVCQDFVFMGQKTLSKTNPTRR